MDKFLLKSYENQEAQFPKLSIFIGLKSPFLHYCIQNVKARIQIQVYKFSKDRVNYFSQFTSEKGKKNFFKCHVQFRES